MKYNKGLFVYNGNAGNDNIQQKLSQTLPVLAKSIKELVVIQTESLDEARRVFVDYADEAEIIIILGGDGTLHECINCIAPLETKPAIAILPGGTSNDFSRLLQIPQNLNQAAQAIIAGDEIEIDVGKTADKYFLNFWGIGLVSETSQNIDENQKRNFGVLSYIMSTLKTLNQADSFHYTITTENETHEGEAILILVMNGKFIGTRQLPLPNAAPNDELLDVLIIKNSTLATFRQLLSMNNPNTNLEQLTELTHFQTSSLTVETDKEEKIDMDGEVSGTTPATIEVMPKQIRMLAGH